MISWDFMVILKDCNMIKNAELVMFVVKWGQSFVRFPKRLIQTISLKKLLWTYS